MMFITSKIHSFYSPNKLLFGMGAINELPSEIRNLGGSKPFLVTDRGVAASGVLDELIGPLEAEGIPYVLWDGVEPEPPSRVVDEAVKRLKQEKCDMVVGVGGGSSLDTAKGISIMATNKGRVLDFCGFELVPKRGVPKILIPTTSGTGSEVTKVFIVTDEKENMKKAIFSHYVLGDVAIVDPILTLSTPPKVTADTGIDALVHAIETYVSFNATPFSDPLAEKAIQWIAKYLPIAYSKSQNLEARYMMSLAATTAGLAFGSGGVGAVHGLAYPLGTGYHMPHGRTNAIMLPHVMRFNIPGNPQKYARIAELMGYGIEGKSCLEAASLSVDAVERLLASIGISSRLRDYKIRKKDIPRLVEEGMKQSRLFGPNPRDMGKKDLKQIYSEAW